MQIFEHKGYTHDMVYNIIRRLKSKKIVVKKDRYRWKLINAVNNEITATDGENDDNKNSKTLLNREKQMPSTTK